MEDNQLVMLGRLEGKVDAILSNQTRIEARLDSHSSRIQALEETKAKGRGVLSTLTFGWTVVGAALTLALKHFWEKL